MAATPLRLALVSLFGLALAAPPRSCAEPAGPSSLDEIPSSARGDVTRLLHDMHRRYGEDAVLIETNLLLNAMRSGALLGTGVRIEGVEPYRGRQYLGFHVDTGLVFDDHTRDEPARLQMLWVTIMEPTLERLQGLSVPADGIKVEMQYHHRPYRSLAELRASIDEPGTSEEASFYLLGADVRELVERRLTARHLVTRTQVAVDGAERQVSMPAGEPPRAAGPD